MKILTAVLTPTFFIILLISALLAAQPAAAQCTYSYTWGFDDNVTGWQMDTGTATLTHSTADGHTAPGMMSATGLEYSSIKLTKANLLTALGLDSGAEIVANGITISAWSSRGTGTDYTRLLLMQTNSDVSGNYTGSGWGELTLTGTRNENIAYLLLQTTAVSSSHAAYWDDVTISIPCENVSGLPPTATPTATPAIPPTATPTVSETLGLVLPDNYLTTTLPGPLPMPSIDNTIDLDVFWDMNNFIAIIQIVQTFFYFETIPEFFKIFLFVMSIVIGLRVVIGIVSSRAAARREAQKEV